MTAPRATPPVRYFAYRCGLDTDRIAAYWPDGTIAHLVTKHTDDGFTERWEAIPRPDYATIRAAGCRCRAEAGPCAECAASAVPVAD